LLSETGRALDYYNRALTILRTLGDRSSEAATLNNIGLLHDSLGEKRKALDSYNLALPMLQATGDERVRAYALSNIGLLQDSLGEKQKSLDYYRQALAILRTVKDRRGESIALNNIGRVYDSLGEKQKALEYFNQALPVLRSVGDARAEAVTLNNIGYVHDSLGVKQHALRYYHQALQVLQAAGDRRTEAVTLNNIGLIHRSLGEREKALDYFGRSQQLRRAVGDRSGEAITLSDIAHVHAASGSYDRAFDDYEQALSLSRMVGERTVEASILRGIAQLERGRGNLTAARVRIEAAIVIIESLRTAIVSQELRSSYFASVQQYFETYIDVLMRLHKARPDAGHDRAAFAASERARARGLLEMLTEAHADIRQGVDPALLERRRTLQQTLNARAAAQMRLTNLNPGSDQLTKLRKEVAELIDQFQEVETQIRIHSPRYAALTQPVPSSLEEIQQQMLDADTLLLEYALGDEQSYLWAVTSSSMKSFELPPRGEIEAATRRVHQLLTARNRRLKFETTDERQARIARADAEFPKAAEALSRILLNPVAADLRKRLAGKRLLIVSDGALNYVPFAALPVPQSMESGVWSRKSKAGMNSQRRGLSDSRLQTPNSRLPLIVDHEIVSLPSASTLTVLRRELSGRTRPPKTLAIVADPVFERTDERVTAPRIKPSRGRQRLEFVEPDGPRIFSRVGETSSAQQAGAVHKSVDEGLDDGMKEAAIEELLVQRLPFTRREADKILSLVSKTDRFAALDFAASRATATSAELGQYRFVHFATHGFINSTHPVLSGLVLSLVDRHGVEQDGFLRVHEIFNLHIPADLIVLSGCRTGLGREIRGEGLIGLTRGFMYAGAARVLVSLWDVADEASAELMARFYEGMLGKDRLRPAAAFRAAQMKILHETRWQAPYYWAAFVLQGEPG
ncbi:MAG: CHAT domain-containing tetratricopeptide repeat protein, partial [Acidobacteriota bacterium]|nr:CHAT domain-containing tetratricopeptide repeat protein [Acidobacteriota bacterium]